MDLGWKRVHLLIFLTFLKYAVGREGWVSQDVQPQNWSVHKLFSPREVQSSVSEAPVTGSIPVEEVALMFAGKSPNASRPLFSPSRQYVQGDFSSSYGSVPHTQSAPSVFARVSSLLQLQGSSSPNAQNTFKQTASRQDSYSQSALSSQYGSGLQRVSAPLASTPGRGGSSSGLSILSELSLSPVDVSDPPTGDQSSSNTSTSTRSSSGLQLGGTSNPQSSSSTGSLSSSRRFFTSTYQGSSGTQLAGGSSQLVSASGLFTQSPSTESQDTPGSSYAELAASPLAFSQSTTDQGSYSQYTPSSESRVGTQLAASHRPVSGQGSSYGLSVEPQDATSQHAPTLFLGAKLPVSSKYYQATRSGSLSQSRLSQEPSASRTQVFQAVLQGSGTSPSSSWSPSRFSSAGGSISSSVQSQHASIQNALASLDAKVPVYSQAAPSASSALSQTSRWEPSTSRWSQGFQTSGSVATQSRSPSQGSKAPRKFSTLTSGASPSQFASKQEGSGRYSGLSIQSQSTSSQPSSGSSGYAKLGASPLGVSQLTSGQGFYSPYTSSSQSRAGTHLAGTSHPALMQTGSMFTGGSSLQMQGTSSQYAPPLAVKVPVYSKAPSGPSLFQSQPSQWHPSSKWSRGFQTSGAVATQSSSPSQGSKAPRKFSTLTSASPSQFASKEGSGRYSGLSSLSQSASTQYSPGSPAYIKRGSSLLDVSRQSASGQRTYSKYTSSSQSRAGTHLTGSSPYVPVQSVRTSTDGSPLQLLGTSSQFAPSPLNAKVHVYSQAAPSGSSLSLSPPSQWQTSSRGSQGFQTSGTVASQSSSPSQGSTAPSRFSTLSSAAGPGHFASKQEGIGKYSVSSSLFQGSSSPYSPGSSAHARHGSSLDISSQSTSDPNSSGLYASSSQSMAGTQPAGSSHMPDQTGSTFTGASFQFQGVSNQYAPSVYRQYAQASSGGSSLTGSEASKKWWPSASSWSQGFQASGTAVPQSSSSQSSQTSSGSSFLPALNPSVAQSSISSSQRTSSFGVGLGPSKLSTQVASGSQIHSQISSGLPASVQHPSDSLASSLGSNVQGASQGIFSGQSSDSTSVVSSSYGSTYGQKPSGDSKSSQSSSATGRYFSSVKG